MILIISGAIFGFILLFSLFMIGYHVGHKVCMQELIIKMEQQKEHIQEFSGANKK